MSTNGHEPTEVAVLAAKCLGLRLELDAARADVERLAAEMGGLIGERDRAVARARQLEIDVEQIKLGTFGQIPPLLGTPNRRRGREEHG